MVSGRMNSVVFFVGQSKQFINRVCSSWSMKFMTVLMKSTHKPLVSPATVQLLAKTGFIPDSDRELFPLNANKQFRTRICYSYS